MSGMKSEALKGATRGLVGLLLIGSLLLGACGQLAPEGDSQPEGTAESSTPEAAVSSTETPEADSSALTLTIWMPPAFSPTSGDLAATLLQDRLAAFHDSHPNVQVEVRLKVEEGEGGLLSALSAASEAAPLAMPDLVLLPSDLLPAAADEGLLIPLDALLNEPLGDDWYAFGQQMVQVEGATYGLPFVGDALILIHRLSAIEQPPRTWNATLAEPLAMGFAAADPQALFSFHQLLAPIDEQVGISAEGEVDMERAQRLLNYYSEGRESGAFPFWLTQYEGPAQTWQAFVEGRMPMVANWSSRLLQSTDENLGGGLLPTQNGGAFALAKGWAWAVSTPRSEQLSVITELAEYLSAADFMAQWSAAAGFIPTRASALAAWSPDEHQALASQVAPAAQMLPSPEMRAAYGPPLSQAALSLLKQEATPPEALDILLAEIASP
jgi:maltose-binding protein MalE